MRFTSFIVAGTLALVASAQTTDSTATSTVASTASTTVSLTAAQSSEAACLQACKAGDVDCQAKCISVPSPSAGQVNATTECVAECPQGNGTATDNSNYADCVNSCIGQNYFTSSGTIAGATGTAASTGSAATASGTAGTSGTASGTGSSPSASETSKDSGADAVRLGVTGLSLLGLLAAFVAL